MRKAAKWQIYLPLGLADQIKSLRGELSKDHFERRIYGGNGISKGCP